MIEKGKVVKIYKKERMCINMIQNSVALQTKKKRKYKKKGIQYFLMSIPFLVYVFAFSYVPLLGWLLAFSDYRAGMRITDIEIKGVQAFVKIFSDRNALRVLRNTLVMSGLGLLVSPISVIFAIMLNEIRSMKFKKFTQTVTTLPHFIGWVVVYGLAFSLFSNSGVVNQLLKLLGLPTSQFGLLGNGDAVWTVQTLFGLWKGLGWNAIVYMAAIAGIDMELYDAAKVDGADRVQLIRHITLPGLIPTYLVLLLLSVGSLLSNGFEQYYVFWNAMVSDKIEVLDYYVYKIGFTANQYPYSIAISMLKSVVSIILLFVANGISKGLRGDSLV